MVLECPKCNTAFTIFDSLDKIRQTCSNGECKILIDIKKLQVFQKEKISIYEITEVKEELKIKALDPFEYYD